MSKSGTGNAAAHQIDLETAAALAAEAAAETKFFKSIVGRCDGLPIERATPL